MRRSGFRRVRPWTCSFAECVKFDWILSEVRATVCPVSFDTHQKGNDMSTTTKVALIGAGMLTVLGVAIAGHHDAAPAPAAPTLSKSLVGMKAMEAFDQLQKDGFPVDNMSNVTIVAPGGRGTYCTDAPPVEEVEIVKAETEGNHVTLTVRDNRVCPAPGPAPRVNVNLPNVNVPNVDVPSYHHDGGESRFCRRHWWC